MAPWKYVCLQGRHLPAALARPAVSKAAVDSTSSSSHLPNRTSTSQMSQMTNRGLRSSKGPRSSQSARVSISEHPVRPLSVSVEDVARAIKARPRQSKHAAAVAQAAAAQSTESSWNSTLRAYPAAHPDPPPSNSQHSESRQVSAASMDQLLTLSAAAVSAMGFAASRGHDVMDEGAANKDGSGKKHKHKHKHK